MRITIVCGLETDDKVTEITEHKVQFEWSDKSKETSIKSNLQTALQNSNDVTLFSSLLKNQLKNNKVAFYYVNNKRYKQTDDFVKSKARYETKYVAGIYNVDVLLKDLDANKNNNAVAADKSESKDSKSLTDVPKNDSGGENKTETKKADSSSLIENEGEVVVSDSVKNDMEAIDSFAKNNNQARGSPTVKKVTFVFSYVSASSSSSSPVEIRKMTDVDPNDNEFYLLNAFNRTLSDEEFNIAQQYVLQFNVNGTETTLISELANEKEPILIHVVTTSERKKKNERDDSDPDSKQHPDRRPTSTDDDTEQDEDDVREISRINERKYLIPENQRNAKTDDVYSFESFFAKRVFIPRSSDSGPEDIPPEQEIAVSEAIRRAWEQFHKDISFKCSSEHSRITKSTETRALTDLNDEQIEHIYIRVHRLFNEIAWYDDRTEKYDGNNAVNFTSNLFASVRDNKSLMTLWNFFREDALTTFEALYRLHIRLRSESDYEQIAKPVLEENACQLNVALASKQARLQVATKQSARLSIVAGRAFDAILRATNPNLDKTHYQNFNPVDANCYYSAFWYIVLYYDNLLPKLGSDVLEHEKSSKQKQNKPVNEKEKKADNKAAVAHAVADTGKKNKSRVQPMLDDAAKKLMSDVARAHSTVKESSAGIQRKKNKNKYRKNKSGKIRSRQNRVNKII
jgi:hypothetical protein